MKLDKKFIDRFGSPWEERISEDLVIYHGYKPLTNKKPKGEDEDE